jgi:hypothetical protein
MSVNAQKLNPKAIETDLYNSLKKINELSEIENVNKEDALEKANDVFAKKLQKYTANYTSTLNEQFDLLRKQELNIATSDDHLLRVYSWDTQTGGTMHYFDNVVQYKTGNKTNALKFKDTKGEGDPGYYYTRIYTLSAGGKTYYLVVYKGVYSSKDVGEGIRIFNIDKGVLNTDVALIKTQSGLHSSINYSYNFFSVIDWKEKPTILYDNATQAIKIPLVNEKGDVTKRFITYKFTGQYFEKVKS